MLVAGINETERRRRKESNLFTTNINFIAWLLEVSELKHSPTSFLGDVNVSNLFRQGVFLHYWSHFHCLRLLGGFGWLCILTFSCSIYITFIIYIYNES